MFGGYGIPDDNFLRSNGKYLDDPTTFVSLEGVDIIDIGDGYINLSPLLTFILKYYKCS